ncbi:MAG: NACHT and WD repeat domain-containing protein [Bacteroidota bacterium]
MGYKNYRYPGIAYFRKKDVDLFFGRENDVEDLFTQITLNQTVVLHGDSGLGKSSLMRAGVLPRMEEETPEYVQVTVKFGYKSEKDKEYQNSKGWEKEYLVDEVVKQIERTLKPLKENSAKWLDRLPFLDPMPKNLWYLGKLIEGNGKKLLLFFDQFEELQSYSQDQIEYFKEQLAYLFFQRIPQPIYNEIRRNRRDVESKEKSVKSVEYKEDLLFLKEPMDAKAVFAVREDMLGTMSLLKDYFPEILKNDYQLKLLDKDGARRAISMPAQVKGDYDSQQFTFSEEALDDLIKKLGDKKSGYDPIEIQIACSNIEQNIAKRKSRIERGDIPKIENMVHQFYENKWDAVSDRLDPLPTKSELVEVRKTMLPALVFDGQRQPVLKEYIHKLERGKDIAEFLLDVGLLSETTLDDGQFYRLSHDRMVIPLEEDLNQLMAHEELKEKTQRLKKSRWATMGVTLVAISMFGLLVHSCGETKKANAQKYLSASKALERENRTMSFVFAKNGVEQGYNSEELLSFLEGLNSDKYNYAIKEFPVNSGVLAFELTEDNSGVRIYESGKSAIWDIRSNSLLEYESFENQDFLKKVSTNTRDLYVYLIKSDRIDSNLEIRDADGNIVQTFLVDVEELDEGRNITISKDEKFILLQNKLFDFKTKKEVGMLPEYSLQDQMASVFINDSDYLAIGYWRGIILLFHINSLQQDPFQLIRLCKYPNGSYINSVITSLVVDEENRFLVAGNRVNSVEVWSLENLELDIGRSVPEIQELAEDAEPIFRLIGHNDDITSMSISDDGKYLISGSKDGIAIIWNLENGKKVSTLRSGSKEPITYVGFYETDSVFITANDRGFWFWKNDDPEKLYNGEGLIKFSPFDFYSNGLDDVTYDQVYDDLNVNRMACNVYHYMRNIPKVNLYPESDEYEKSLKRAINEVSEKYVGLKEIDEYLSLNADFRDIIEKEYLQLRLAQVDFFTDQDLNAQDNNLLRKSAIYSEHLKVFLKDTIKLKSAIEYGLALINLSRKMDTNTATLLDAENNIELAVKLIHAYHSKFPEATGIENLSVQAILYFEDSNQFDKAYQLSKELRDMGVSDYMYVKTARLAPFAQKSEEIIDFYLNRIDIEPTVQAYLIVAHLMLENETEAIRIFNYLENEGYETSEFILDHIVELTTNGISSRALEKFSKKVRK